MSDDQNLNPEYDKQYLNLHPKETQNDDEEINPSIAYDFGYGYLKAKGFILERNIAGSHCYHHIYKLKRPTRIKGITTPTTFKVLKKLHTPDDLTIFQNTVKEIKHINPLIFKFWQPMITPDAKKLRPIYQYTLQLIQGDEFKFNYESTEPLDLGISVNPITELDENQNPQDVAPRAWLPLKEWFDPQIQQLKIEDILTIFPPTEREMLSLIIGRAVVGKSNNIHRGETEPITHTARMCALVIGDAGIGKSTILDGIINALQGNGYTRSTFENIGTRFNMAEPISSDILYVDDATQKSLEGFIKSPITKKVVTGHGLIRTENKGVDAVNVDPRATIFIVTNEYNPRLVYGIDTGTADRIKILSTYREAELERLELTTISKRSPDIRPHHHLTWLSEQFKVSKKAILLWLARLSADKFLETIHPQPNGVNLLEKTVERLTLKLRIPLHKNITLQVMCALDFAYYLREFEAESKIIREVEEQENGIYREFSSLEYRDQALVLFRIIGCKYAHKIIALIRWHYENVDPDNSVHPWHTMRYLDANSLSKSMSNCLALAGASQLERNVEFFSGLLLKTGLPLTKDPVWLIASFNAAIVNRRSMLNIVLWLRKVTLETDIITAGEVQSFITDSNLLSSSLTTPIEAVCKPFSAHEEEQLRAITP